METTAFIELLTSLVTAVIGWMGSVVDFIIAEPVILIPMLMFFVTGGAIGLITRLMRG